MPHHLGVLLFIAVLTTATQIPALVSVAAQIPKCDGKTATIYGRSGNVEGTGKADVIVGTTAKDRIHGRGGNDTICAYGTGDILYGDKGVDTLLAGTSVNGGNVHLIGGPGADTLRGNPKSPDEHPDFADYSTSLAGVTIDMLTGATDGFGTSDGLVNIRGAVGSSHNDQILGTPQGDDIYGGGGDDSIQGGDDSDRIFGEGGNDNLVGESLQPSSDTGKDQLFGGSGNDVMTGGKDRDSYDGGPNTDAGDFANLSGPDPVTADLAAGRAETGSWVEPLVDVENLVGTKGADFLYGDDTSNALVGGKGNDTLRGRDGDDGLAGGSGDDILDGGAGSDSLDGGTNNPPNGDPATPTGDWADYQQGPLDTFLNLSLADGIATGWGTDTLEGIENAIGSGGYNNFTGDAGNNILVGCDQIDTLSGEGGDDVLIGLTKDDSLHGDARFPDDLAGGGQPGDDEMYGLEGDDSLFPGLGNDLVDGGVDTQYGDSADFGWQATAGVTVDLRTSSPQGTGQGTDTFLGIETLYGTVFGDTLIGNDRRNILEGGEGNDHLYGYEESDFLDGGIDFDDGDGGDGSDTCESVEDNLNCETIYARPLDAALAAAGTFERPDDGAFGPCPGVHHLEAIFGGR